MAHRPPDVLHPLSWVRHVDETPWPTNEPPSWRSDDRYDDELELAFNLARCAVSLDVTLSQAARQVGVGRPRAMRAMTALRVHAAPRRGRGSGPLTDSAIFKRFARSRKREGRVCLAPGCDRRIGPNMRIGTYACSGRCRKRIFDAGGREAITQAEAARRRKPRSRRGGPNPRHQSLR